MSKLNNTFPDFSCLSSIFSTSPSIQTEPDSILKSDIFIFGSLIVGTFPSINGVSSSSSGSLGKFSLLIDIITFAITVISPAYASNPAFPIVFIPSDCFIYSTT